MSRRGEGGAAGVWSAEQTGAFFTAFHKHGQDFEQVSADCGRPAGECEALYRRQHAYLSIPAALQSAQAFSAIVDAAQKEEPSREASGGGGGGAEAAASGAAASDLKQEEGEEGSEEGEEGAGLAAGRSRRTPKRGVPSGRRTPVSGAKRGRGDDPYEYYEEAADGGAGASESARKRRGAAARRGLDFQGRGRPNADDAKGVDALLALALAGEESLGDGLGSGSDGEGGAAPARRRSAKKATPQRRRAAAAADDEGSEEEPEDAGAMEDEEDEDFAPPPRRTPYSTPAKGRLPRPGSAHATPRRSGGSRGAPPPGGLPAASPGGLALRGFSPYMGLHGLEGAGDMLGDALMGGLGDPLGYIASPAGFPPFPAALAPSPQNPMPRLRRRKSAPERLPGAGVASPVKSLFTRRSSLAGGPGLIASFGYGPSGGAGGEEGGGAAGPAGPAQSPAEAALRHCLQQPRTRRWAAAEFFYSALDRPFFMFNPLAGLLAALGLGEGAALARKEWNLLRSGLGKPRRLSLRFLKEERVRLERWREGCRDQYQAGAAAVADPKVADHLPRPLGVGQRCVARHPATRQLHDGSVLTVAHNCYRVQFDRQELGVELVQDTDLMPAEPAENLPPALLGRGRLVLNGRQVINGQPVRPVAPRLPPALPPAAAMAAAAAAAAASTPLAPAAVGAGLLPAAAKADVTPAAAAPGEQPAQQQQQQQAQAQQQQAPQQQAARAADAKALAELVVGLDKKEALLLQMRSMNDEAAAGMHADPASGAAAPHFVNAYASVVLQLKDTNERVAEKLEQLDRPGSSGTSSGELGGAPPQHQELGESLAADAALQRQLAAHTPAALGQAALAEARAILASCRRKLSDSAGDGSPQAAAAAGSPAADAGGSQPGDEQQQQQPAEAAAGASPGAADAAQQQDYWSSEEGRRLGALIEGCVHSLVLLQRGAAGGGLPPDALAAALDAALAEVRPTAAANQALYTEIEEAMRGLKQQLQLASAAS